MSEEQTSSDEPVDDGNGEDDNEHRVSNEVTERERVHETTVKETTEKDS